MSDNVRMLDTPRTRSRWDWLSRTMTVEHETGRVEMVSAGEFDRRVTGRDTAHAVALEREAIAKYIESGINVSAGQVFSCLGCPVCPDIWESEGTCPHWDYAQWLGLAIRDGAHNAHTPQKRAETATTRENTPSRVSDKSHTANGRQAPENEGDE